MDEQQILQFLSQIPLEFLQNYIQQRMQQENAAVTQQDMVNQMPTGEVPTQGAPAQEAPQMVAYGGRLGNWSPYIDIYACGGRMGSTATKGRMGARRKKY